MEIRRGLMAQMAGKVPRLVYSKSITLEETATSTNRKKIQLPVIQNGFVLILIDEIPKESDPSIYIALTSYTSIIKEYGGTPAATTILRPSGTVGSDSTGSTYNSSTGVLSLGGSYAYYPQGETYNIYAFEIPVEE